VALHLVPCEPEAGPWHVALLTNVTATLMQLSQRKGADHRPVVLAVDGRSSSGKTTLAARLRGAVAESAVVHTDDIAWRHSRFGWADLLIDGILIPARAGRPIAFRPPQWDNHQRLGAIEVPAGCPLLIIEGVGVARRESAYLIDAAVWVQSDDRETERRSLARVGQAGESPTVQHHRDWMAEEVPFVAHQRPWERADLVVCGTPEISFDPATELVVAPGPTGSSRRRIVNRESPASASGGSSTRHSVPRW
jgi:energy-coupling factor transporter ATP-binding protein EcfA2